VWASLLPELSVNTSLWPLLPISLSIALSLPLCWLVTVAPAGAVTEIEYLPDQR
jgi:hypothetical protein